MPTSVRFAVLLILLAAMSACGGGGSNTPTSSSLAGNWQMTLQDNNTGAVKTESGFLLQSGNALTGNLLLTGQTECPGVGAASGQVTSPAVSLTINQIAQTATLTGQASSDGSTLSGTYSILASGCGGTQVGKWMATLVKPLSGNFKATFTSGATSIVFPASGMIAQNSNSGGSTTNLSGSLSASDAPCLTAATITGVISGTTVLLNFSSQEGAPLGQYRGTMTTDGTMITGNYNLLSTPSPPGGQCDDFGTAVITIQP